MVKNINGLLVIFISFFLHFNSFGTTTNHSSELEKRFRPFPEWWDDVGTVDVEIKDQRTLLKFWQSEKRCCKREDIEENNRKFVKTIYYSLIEKPHDLNTFVFGVKLMNISYIEHPNMLEVQKLLIEKFHSFKQDTSLCANCKEGDTIARVIYSIFPLYRKKGDYQAPIDIAINFLNAREDVSDYHQGELFRLIVRYYGYLGEKEKGLDIGEKFLNRFPPGDYNYALNRELKAIRAMVQNYSKKKNQVIHLKNKDSIKLEYEITDSDIKEKLDGLSSRFSEVFQTGLIWLFSIVGGLVLLFTLLYLFQRKDGGAKEEDFFDDLDNN